MKNFPLPEAKEKEWEKVKRGVDNPVFLSYTSPQQTYSADMMKDVEEESRQADKSQRASVGGKGYGSAC